MNTPGVGWRIERPPRSGRCRGHGQTPRRSDVGQRTCSIPDCDKEHYGRGWCRMHHARWVRNGDPLAFAPPHPPKQICSIASCDKPQLARSYCNNHYQNWWRCGDPLGRPKPFIVPRCHPERPHYGKGKCRECYHLEIPSSKRRDGHLRRTYGISSADYDAMLGRQGGGCAICHAAPTWNKPVLPVDHDHLTGRVRSLLCHRCNIVLGLVSEDVLLLEAMEDYLRVNA